LGAEARMLLTDGHAWRVGVSILRQCNWPIFLPKSYSTQELRSF
jgi:hypothetical protein